MFSPERLSGSLIRNHSNGSPPAGLMSAFDPKKVWNRFVGLLASKPERPPAPPMLSSQVSTDPSNWKVPLSWVPPCNSPSGFRGLIDRCWNCSVCRPELRLKIAVGTAESSRWQVRSTAGDLPMKGRVGHESEMETYCPLERTRPPSDPSNHTSGLPGANTRAC